MSDERRSETWRRRGAHLTWTDPNGSAPPVEIFHVEAGSADAPVLLLVHGFPTCSIDWYQMVPLLEDRFRVCALDFPGYGFSDKPRGWPYGLAGDARLLDFYVREVVGADSVVVMAHDRGSSVALNYVLDRPGGGGDGDGTTVEHLVLTNGNIFLPLSNLTEFQRRVLDPDRAPAVLEMITPALLATGMGASTFSPPRPAEDPDVAALADTFAHQDGVQVLHETIQYLVERSRHERQWLEALAAAAVPTTVIWGLEDTVSPPRVATHVWSEFLMLKPGRNRFYLVPGANHYLQADRPRAVVSALLHALEDTDSPPGPIAPEPGAPVLVDRSRPRLPEAGEVL